MSAALLDTDMLSEVLKQRHTVVVQRAAAYFSQHAQFTFSAFTRYEILRGLKQLNATAQLNRFEQFCTQSAIIPIDDVVFDRAADLWVLARRSGFAANDADLIIAATAMQHNLALVTGNTAHFGWISGLFLSDWRMP